MSFSIFSHPKLLSFAVTKSVGNVTAERRFLEGRGAGRGWVRPFGPSLLMLPWV